MPSPKNNTLTELISKVADHQKRQNPFVIFSYPDDSRVKAILQKDAVVHTSSDFTESGFVFSPFGDDLPTVLLKSDRTLEASLEENLRVLPGDPLVFRAEETEKEQYKQLVKGAVDAIRAGKLKKVVLSRRIEVGTSKSALEIFTDLLYRYPTAFCYCWYHPAVGCWAGATPEILLQVAGSQFTTVALAGTMEKSGSVKPEWKEKEKDEQQLVTNYIVEVLNDEGIEVKSSEVETIAAGSLQHLKTTLTGNLSEWQTTRLIKALHPTPAVCGIPLDHAKNYILKNEGSSRKYYTGFLGELNVEEALQTRLFVNLRCVELSADKALIHVGGGITLDSDPDKEWEETIAKSHTVLRAL